MSLVADSRPAWSRSQMTALKECGRKFLLSRRASDAASPYESAAAALRKIKNRHLWAGSAVHSAVASILALARQGQPIPDAAAFLERVREDMRVSFKASRDGRGERLFEHEYNIAVPPEAWRRHWTQVESAVTWFLGSRWLQRLARLGPECWKAVDEVLAFDVNGIKAYVKIDCGVEAGGRVCVMDWKTSAPGPSAEATLQVAALYAHEMWGGDPSSIDAVAVSLIDGKTHHATVNEETLMETHLRIEEEAASLSDAAQNLGTDPFALPVASDPGLCARCSFQRLCFPAAAASPARLDATAAAVE